MTLLAAVLMVPAAPVSAQQSGSLTVGPATVPRPAALLLPLNPDAVSPAAIRASVAQLPLRAPAAAGPRGRLVVGDSLMVSVTKRMQRRGFTVHAKVGRQFSTAPGIVRSYGAKLPRNVVIELGTNGTIRAADCRAVVRAAGKDRRVFLVTSRVPRSWEKANLATIQACDQHFEKSRVRIIDWYMRSAGHPDWYGADRVHLSPEGQRRFARRIDHALDTRGLR